MREWNNTKSIIYIILAFLAMAYTGVTFIFSILAYKATSARTWNISELVYNWKETPIVAITATNEDSCARDFEPIIGKIWPGTFDGCYWDDKVTEEKLKNTLVVGKWDKIQKDHGWKDYDRRNPIIIRSFYPGVKLIWVQRIGDNIINIMRPKEEDEYKCPDGYINCGPEGKGKDQLCIPETQDWPIIAVSFGQKGQKEGWTEVPLDDKQSLFYSTTDESSGLPISEFILSEGDYVWIKSEDTNIPENKKIYSLLNNNFYKGWVTNVDGLQMDDRWEPLLSVTEWDIYNMDHLFHDTVNKLPGYVNQTQMMADK